MSLDNLSLFTELRVRESNGDRVAGLLAARLTDAFPEIDRILRDVRVFFRHFTDHSVDHSLRIVRNIESFLGPRQYAARQSPADCITSVDIFLIIASALIHDIGMVIPEGELAALMKDTRFLARAAEFLKNQDASDQDWLRKGVGRVFVADYVRARHPARALPLVRDHLKSLDRLLEGRLGHWLGEICAGHGLSFESICDDKRYPRSVEVQLPQGMQVSCNPRFVTLCLRIGDLLDMGTQRACPTLLGLSEPLTTLSRAHWDQYRDIEVQNLRPGSEITIAGTCPTQEAERLLRGWVKWLEEECANCALVQNQDEPRYRINIGRIRYSVQPVQVDGAPAYEFIDLRFNLDEKMVFERLFGKSLYGRVDLALRELIQNCIDASRARLAIDLSKTDEWARASGHDHTRTTLLRKRIERERARMPIEAELYSVPREGGEERWLAITDHGIGMTREVIDRYLLKVGRSRWSNDPSIQNLGLGRIAVGAFGIGFLSCLMIADRIIVETQSCLPDERGIRLTIFGWQGFASTEPLTRDCCGTTIRLRLADPFDLDLKQLAATLGGLVPLPDFPLHCKAAQRSAEAPRLCLVAGEDPVGQAVIPLDAQGSIVLIRSRPSVDTTLWVGDAETVEAIPAPLQRPIVCQDGIAVSEMFVPAGPDAGPFPAVLESFRFCCDLRGESRAPLDLSRNLIEGGNNQFWQRRLPEFWNAIYGASSKQPAAARALSTLAQQLMSSRSTLGTALWGDSFTRLTVGKVETRGDAPIICVDPSWRGYSDVGQPSDVMIWLLPVDVVGSRLEAPWTRAGIESDWYSEGHGGPVDDDDTDEPTWDEVFVAVDNVWNSIVLSRPWACEGAASSPVLVAKATSGALSVRNLIALKLSPTLIAVTNPIDGSQMLFPRAELEEIADRARDAGLSLADFYMFLIYVTAGAELSEWGKRGELSEFFVTVASRIEKRRGDDSDALLEDDDENNDADDDFVGSFAEALEENFELRSANFLGIVDRTEAIKVTAAWEQREWEAAVNGVR